MKKSMVFAFLALSLAMSACGGNKNPFGSSDPFKDSPDDVKNGMLKPKPQAPDEKPIGKDVFVIDGEGFAEHIVLVVKTADLVPTLHEAYERIGHIGTGFGVLIAGPSKTADIEQCLVIGAHGARGATVVLLGN